MPNLSRPHSILGEGLDLDLNNIDTLLDPYLSRTSLLRLRLGAV